MLATIRTNALFVSILLAVTVTCGIIGSLLSAHYANATTTAPVTAVTATATPQSAFDTTNNSAFDAATTSGQLGDTPTCLGTC